MPFISPRGRGMRGPRGVGGVSQPKVSALAHYKLDGFSAEQLMTFLAALGQDVEIVVKDRPRARGAGRVSVRAA